MTKTLARAKRKTEDAPRARRARAVSDMLPDIGRAAFRRFGFIQSAIVSRWPEIVGPRYAGVSSPESIRFPPGRKSGGALTLIVEGAHAPMMQHVAPVLIERVNMFFGYEAVTRVIVRQGLVRVARTERAPRAEAAIPAPLGDSLRAIGDLELRQCLESLARGLSARDHPPVTAIPIVGKIGETKR